MSILELLGISKKPKSMRTGAIQKLSDGGTRVSYNGKVFHLAGRVVRADEIGQPIRIASNETSSEPSPTR